MTKWDYLAVAAVAVVAGVAWIVGGVIRLAAIGIEKGKRSWNT